jgi:hypothetical protein
MTDDRLPMTDCGAEPGCRGRRHFALSFVICYLSFHLSLERE